MKYSRDLAFLLVFFLVVTGTFAYVYVDESDDVVKGKVDYTLSYTFNMENQGPLNLTYVSIRLAELKTWDPVQTVTKFKAQTTPNITTSDEYNNSYFVYTFNGFEVNRTLSLIFNVSLTLNILDFTNISPDQPTQSDDSLYRLYTRYNPIADNLDPRIQQMAASLWTTPNSLDFIYNAYNFSSTYIQYRLLSNIKGASFALRNGYGDCDEYTALFIALLRAQKIAVIEHTAWLADFAPNFETTDDGAAAHAYPMFYLPNYGLLPADPTRGATSLFNNWLKTDEKRITMTRGPDNPYRKLTYRWIPKENYSNPLVVSNYTINIFTQDIQYFSKIRLAILVILFAIPVYYLGYSSVKGYYARKARRAKLEKILSIPSDRKMS